MPVFVENGGDVTFDLRVQATDVKINGADIGDVLALDFVRANPSSSASAPESTPVPTALPSTDLQIIATIRPGQVVAFEARLRFLAGC